MDPMIVTCIVVVVGIVGAFVVMRGRRSKS